MVVHLSTKFQNFENLCKHQDLDVCARWSFFAASHGKSTCNKIKVRVKRFQISYGNEFPTWGNLLRLLSN